VARAQACACGQGRAPRAPALAVAESRLAATFY